MRAQALRARPRRRGLPADTGERSRSAIAANVLDRQFKASAPNQKWVADFTYIWTAEGWLYVAAVIDLFSRRVVGWSMSAAMTAQLVADALMMAIWRRGKPNALLHHSDQGSQYTSTTYLNCLNHALAELSMSGAGNCYDNAVVESFFSTLKTECVTWVFNTRAEARTTIFEYLEVWYNRQRLHSTLGYRSPVDFENLTL